MKSIFVLALMLPVMALASEPTAKPSANHSATAPLKNAPPTQVDNLKPTSGSSANAQPKNAAPTQVDNLKPMGKPKAEPSGHQSEPALTSSHAGKPTEPPVVQYVPPKYNNDRPALVRQHVPSKAPGSRSAHSSKPKSSHSSSHSTKSVSSQSMAVTPGIVRVLPSSSLPAGKVLPVGKSADGAGTSEQSPSKPRLTWGETVTVKSATMPAPEIYIVKDPELRWQQYSYP